MMPANCEELDAWIASTCVVRQTFDNGCTSEYESVSADYARALADYLGAALLYGPRYSRQAWENFTDSVRAFHHSNYEGAQLFRERAERAAMRSTREEVPA